MQTSEHLEQSAAMLNWVADVFYHPPSTEKLKLTKEIIEQWPNIAGDPSNEISAIITSIETDQLEVINHDFHCLFIGPGKKLVYPWGSVYTDQEGLLFGNSTQFWESFCQHNEISITPNSNEPTDHFGLMFSALSAIMSSENTEEVKLKQISTLLKDHFSPWGEKVLNDIHSHSKTNYYISFSILASHIINHWKNKLAL
ncbi:molecular chaperone [Shewanella maritima]|uniref:TorD/DmsD family molecular chaperone n=1 Tax=Shewanella maritima TaxID=2520507 RepID=UPI0037352E1F